MIYIQKIIPHCIWGILLISSVFAQPASFSFTPTSTSGLVLGQAQIDGLPADGMDYIAAFDPNGNCAGASQLVVNLGLAYIALPIYGDDATTPSVDEGMNAGEYFTLKLWDASTNQILDLPNGCNPTQFTGWLNTNGTPMPGYNDPNTVFDAASVTPLSVSLAPFSTVCENDPAVVLSGGLPSGGVYKGPSGPTTTLDPSILGPGTYTITYVFLDSVSCLSDSASETITIEAKPSVSLTAFSDVCVDVASFALTGGLPSGGTYSGPGVIGGNFDPSTAGVGTHNIQYTFSNAAGCLDSAVQTLVVNPLPTVGLPSFSPVCLDVGSFALTGGSPSGGTYSGAGVSGGIFDPTVAGVGSHPITYTYTDGSGCTADSTVNLIVNGIPSVSMAALNDICEDATPFALSGGSPSGGTYSGPGVSGGLFDPGMAGPGTHTISYSYTDPNGCDDQASETIMVNPAPVVSLAPIGDLCEDGAAINLVGSPSGGIYGGPGVSLDSFDPQIAGPGTHTITYSYTDSNGCSGVDSQNGNSFCPTGRKLRCSSGCM